MLTLLLALALPAAADLDPAERWVGGDFLALGVHPDGSLVNDALPLGMVWDPDGPEGTLPLTGDLLTPGRDFEAWSVTWTAGGTAGSLVAAGPDRTGTLPLAWDEVGLSEAMSWLHGTGATEALEVETWIAVPWEAPVAWLTLSVTALQDLEGVEAARVVDPDQDATWGYYSTLNEAGDGWAVSEGPVGDGRSLALAAVGGEGGICAWCTTAAEVRAGSTGPRNGDEQIGVAVALGDLAAGETATVTFAYGLALDPAEAVALAEEAAADDDLDDDGVAGSAGDCDDRDPAVAPGLAEEADGLDNDCDGTPDEDTRVSDDDGDGWTEDEGDCDDTRADVFPGAAPVDGVADADCDGHADDGTWPPDPPEDVVIPGEETVVGGCVTAPGVPRVLALPVLALLLLGARRRDGRCA